MGVRNTWRRLLNMKNVGKISFILSPFKYSRVLLVQRTSVKINSLMNLIVISHLIKILKELSLEMSHVNISNSRKP